jgi:chaperonin GroES
VHRTGRSKITSISHPDLDSGERDAYMSGTRIGGVLTAVETPIFQLVKSNELDEGESLMKFKPLHDRVLVEPLDAEVKTAGGVIIPDTAQEKPQEGKIISTGSGARGEDGKIIALDVKAGDLVLYGKWSGTEVKVDGKDLLIMKESDIMGIIQ